MSESKSVSDMEDAIRELFAPMGEVFQDLWNKEHPTNKKTYYVTQRVEGRQVVEVKASSEAEAIELANRATVEADFGELEDIDWHASHICDDHGNEKIIDF